MKRLIVIAVILTSGCSWSKFDTALGVTSTVATAADIYTTTQLLNNPGNYELNPILGKHPSDTKVIMVLATSQVITLVIAHFFPTIRPWLLGGKTVINTGWAIHNLQLDWEGGE